MSRLSPEEHYKIYQEIEKRVRKRIERRKEFFSHLVAYVVTMIGMWLLVGFDKFDEFWGVAAGLVAIGWTMGIVIHFVQYTLDETGEREIEAELARMGLFQSGKAKREKGDHDTRLVRLGRDGELFDLDEEEYPEDRYYDEAH